jgi:hypothetical protein
MINFNMIEENLEILKDEFLNSSSLPKLVSVKTRLFVSATTKNK